MISTDALGLWLRTSPAEHTKAMCELVMSTDLRIVHEADCDAFTVARTHESPVTHYETGSTLPMMPSGTA